MQRNPRQFHAVDSGLYAPGLGLHAVDSGLYGLGSGFLVSETWIPDASRNRDFGFQSPVLWISGAKISRIPESG